MVNNIKLEVMSQPSVNRPCDPLTRILSKSDYARQLYHATRAGAELIEEARRRRQRIILEARIAARKENVIHREARERRCIELREEAEESCRELELELGKNSEIKIKEEAAQAAGGKDHVIELLLKSIADIRVEIHPNYHFLTRLNPKELEWP